MHEWMGWNHGMGWGGSLLMILFWGLALLGVIFLVRWLLAGGSRSRSSAEAPHTETAVEILKKRYARGEITREEYQQMKAELE